MAKKVIIIGAGPAGLAVAKKISKDKRAEVTIVDMGKEAEKRYCPERENKECLSCIPCNKLYGGGGAGLMSDGKLLFHPGIGNNLEEVLEISKNLGLIEDVRTFFSEYGISQVREKSKEVEELERKALNNEIDFIYPNPTHIGSDRLPNSSRVFSLISKHKG